MRFYNSVNLQKNSLIDAVEENRSTPPSSPKAGETYYDQVDNKMKYYTGTNWISMGGGVDPTEITEVDGGTFDPST